MSLIDHWARPRGVLGSLAGWEMAVGKQPASELAVELLEICEDDRVLEIGYGPGVTVAHLAAAAQRGRVAGVDHSALMLRQAVRRNRDAIEEGRVDLRCASAERLPFGDAVFEKAVSLNSVQFWPDRLKGLREVARVLVPQGRLVVLSRTSVDGLEEAFGAAGLGDVAVSRHGVGRRPLVAYQACRVAPAARTAA